jgi:hypothetical protein
MEVGVKKIELPEVMEGTWADSYQYKMIIAINQMMDKLSEIDERLKRDEGETKGG